MISIIKLSIATARITNEKVAFFQHNILSPQILVHFRAFLAI